MTKMCEKKILFFCALKNTVGFDVVGSKVGLEMVGWKAGDLVVRVGHFVGREVVGSLLGIFVGVVSLGALLGEDAGCVVTGFVVGRKVGISLGSVVDLELGPLIGSG